MGKQILVLGAAGMAGHVITTYLRENGYAVDTLSARNKFDNETVLLDISDKDALESFLRSKNYDVVINAVGILVKNSEDHKDSAVYINAYIPHYLEAFYKDTSTKIIHLSTDCVFSGYNGPYTEKSIPDGELFYDRSKALGELNNSKDLTFRMSIIGPDQLENGIGLFNWFYAQSGTINGFSKAIWNGITTIELAKAIDAAIKADLIGLYHLVPNSNISKYDLLKLFAEVFKRTDIKIEEDDRDAPDKTLINTREDFDFSIPTYPEMIKEMQLWIENHSSMYKHYER